MSASSSTPANSSAADNTPKLQGKLTLFYMNAGRIPEFIRQQIDGIANDEDVKYWLKPECMSPDARVKYEVYKKNVIVDNAVERPCFLVRFLRPKRQSPADKYTLELFDSCAPAPSDDATYSASLIIIPRAGKNNNREALVYGFGYWHLYINHFAKKPEWGLRIALNKDVCGETLEVKHGTSGTLLAPNTKKTKESLAHLDSLSYLSVEPGEHHLHQITVASRPTAEFLPLQVTGSDTLVYSPKGHGLPDLVKQSERLYEISLSSRNLHPDAAYYLDEEVTDETITTPLNDRLLSILLDGTNYCRHLVNYAHMTNKYIGKDLEFSYSAEASDEAAFDGNASDLDASASDLDASGVSASDLDASASDVDASGVSASDLDASASDVDASGVSASDLDASASDFDASDGRYGLFLPTLRRAMQSDGANLYTKITVRNRTTKAISRHHVMMLVQATSVTLDEPEDDRLYRYESGSWFCISQCKLDRTQQRLNDYRIGYDECGLEEYHRINVRPIESKRIDHEGLYNSGAVEAFNGNAQNDPQSWAILIDRNTMNIPPMTVDKFEFGDLLIRKNDRLYIVHVKLASDTAQSGHHGEQILRCVEFLNSMQKKGDKAWTLLVRGCIKTMQMTHNVILEKGEKWKGEPYRSRYLKIKNVHNNANWKNNIIKKIREEIVRPNDLCEGIINFLNSDRFIDGYNKEYQAILNTLFDCNIDDPKNFTWDVAKSYLNVVNQCIRLKEKLFPDGFINREMRANTWIVMALINNTGNEYRCRKQQLPIYSTTMSKVIAAGFKFAWTVIPEAEIAATTIDEVVSSVQNLQL